MVFAQVNLQCLLLDFQLCFLLVVDQRWQRARSSSSSSMETVDVHSIVMCVAAAGVVMWGDSPVGCVQAVLAGRLRQNLPP